MISIRLAALSVFTICLALLGTALTAAWSSPPPCEPLDAHALAQTFGKQHGPPVAQCTGCIHYLVYTPDCHADDPCKPCTDPLSEKPQFSFEPEMLVAVLNSTVPPPPGNDKIHVAAIRDCRRRFYCDCTHLTQRRCPMDRSGCIPDMTSIHGCFACERGDPIQIDTVLDTWCADCPTP